MKALTYYIRYIRIALNRDVPVPAGRSYDHVLDSLHLSDLYSSNPCTVKWSYYTVEDKLMNMKYDCQLIIGQ